MIFIGFVDSSGRAVVDGSGEWIVDGSISGTFRLLEDHWINQTFYPAGTIFQAPQGWFPTGNAEPMDAGTAAYYYSFGPQPPGLIRTQFSGQPVITPGLFPTTYWLEQPPNVWILTGLGAGFAPIME